MKPLRRRVVAPVRCAAALSALVAIESHAGAQSPPRFAPLPWRTILGPQRADPAVVLADFNADGRADILVSDTTRRSGEPVHQFSVILNRGDDTFGLPVTTEIPGAAAGYAALGVGDLNGDGAADVVTSRRLPPGGGMHANVSVVLGRPSGAMVDRTDYCTAPLSSATNSIQHRALAVGDVNNDGRDDVVTTTADARISVMLGDGSGRLLEPILSGRALTYDALLLGDVNGDGRVDVVTLSDSGSAAYADTTIDVNLGLGDGTFEFARTTHIAVRFKPAPGMDPRAYLRKMDADDLPDLVVFGDEGAVFGEGGIFVLHSEGGGGFTVYFNESREADPVRTQTLTLADVDSDGDADIIKIPAPGAGPGEILLNNGIAGFPVRLPLPESPVRVRAAAAGDLVGTYLPDVVIVTVPDDPSDHAEVGILRLEAPPPCLADITGDGVVGPDDLPAFLSLWYNDVAMSGRAGDFNGDGSVDGADVTAFVSVWFAALAVGC